LTSRNFDAGRIDCAGRGQRPPACENDTIETIAEDGDLIILKSGQAYDVAAPDQLTASRWQEGDNVRVCGGTIINKDERDERIKVAPH
jgi:hypothetical protein